MTRIAGRLAPSRLVVGIAALLLAMPGFLAAAPDKARQDELVYRLRQDCGSCHGYTLKGGLGPPLVPAALRGKDSDVLAEIIIHGLPNTPMPPWAFEITKVEAVWLVGKMKKGLSNAK